MSLSEFVVLAIALAAFCLLPLLICVRLAPQRKGGPLWLWVILSLVFGWLAVLVLRLLPHRASLGG